MNDLKKIAQAAIDALGRGEPVCLVTVAGGAGSSPRGAGAHLLASAAGRLAGTIGGGGVEYRAVETAVEMLRTQARTPTRGGGRRAARRAAYHLRPGDEARLGMLCGGDIEVFFQCIDPDDGDARGLLENLLERLDRDEDLWLSVGFTGAGAGAWAMGLHGPGAAGVDAGVDAGVHAAANRPTLAVRGDQVVYTERVNTAGRICVFGGGHVARALVPVLAGVDFRCVVFDSRSDFARPEFFPDAFAVIHGDYGRIDDHLRLTPRDSVLVMTHDSDLAVLRQAAPRDWAYIGVIGSRAKAETIRRTLREEGVGEAALARLHIPIGLPIHSETSEEIAVSVAAELIRERAERRRGTAAAG